MRGSKNRWNNNTHLINIVLLTRRFHVNVRVAKTLSPFIMVQKILRYIFHEINPEYTSVILYDWVVMWDLWIKKKRLKFYSPEIKLTFVISFKVSKFYFLLYLKSSLWYFSYFASSFGKGSRRYVGLILLFRNSKFVFY